MLDYWIRHKFSLKYHTQKWCNSFVSSPRKVLPAHFLEGTWNCTADACGAHQVWLSDEGLYKVLLNCMHVPLAMCRGIQCSAGRCWRALLCHTQYLQTLSLRPTAPMTGQHGRVHPLTGRIWSHNHNTHNTHCNTNIYCVHFMNKSHYKPYYIQKESKVCLFFIYNYI